jgi:hypothetical protein
MTKAAFLDSADSYEIAQWFAYFKVRGDRERDARESAEFQARIERGQ